jgi:hypothetical protein
MAKGRMAKIMDQSHTLGKVFVELQRTRQGSGNLGHFDRMGQPGAIMIPVMGNEDLRFVFQAPKGCCVDDPVAITLEIRTRRAGFFRVQAPARCPGVCGKNGSFAISKSQSAPVQCHFAIRSSAILFIDDPACRSYL